MAAVVHVYPYYRSGFSWLELTLKTADEFWFNCCFCLMDFLRHKIRTEIFFNQDFIKRNLDYILVCVCMCFGISLSLSVILQNEIGYLERQ